MTNTNALDIFTLIRIAPHSIPLPRGGEGEGEGPYVKEFNALVLMEVWLLVLELDYDLIMDV
jgi:hypothetical protein